MSYFDERITSLLTLRDSIRTSDPCGYSALSWAIRRLTRHGRNPRARIAVDAIVAKHIPEHNDIAENESHYHCEECAEIIRSKCVEAVKDAIRSQS